jgi:hypothetical protein
MAIFVRRERDVEGILIRASFLDPVWPTFSEKRLVHTISLHRPLEFSRHHYLSAGTIIYPVLDSLKLTPEWVLVHFPGTRHPSSSCNGQDGPISRKSL